MGVDKEYEEATGLRNSDTRKAARGKKGLAKSIVDKEYEEATGLRNSDTRKAARGKKGLAKSIVDKEYEEAMESFKNEKRQQQGKKNLKSSLRQDLKSSLTQSIESQENNNNKDARKARIGGKVTK